MRRTKSNRFAIRSSKISYRKSVILVCCVAVLLLCVLQGGCPSKSPPRQMQQQEFSSEYEELSAPYDQTRLKSSLTLDVLPRIQRSQDKLDPRIEGTELLSHSESVVASLGQSKDGHKTWFNMVTFHEYRLNVIRKYFFEVDDKVRGFRIESGRGLRFDCEMVLEQDVLERSYASENAKQIAMLRHVLENLRKDINELSADIDAPGQNNQMLNVCGMLINQTFEIILLKLDSSPVLAARLSGGDGVEFDHINFDEGRIEMVVLGDTVVVKIRLGAFVSTINNNQ
ncbi:MAG: hypothetical protein ACYS80_00110 [Planctomycetota bacterium]